MDRCVWNVVSRCDVIVRDAGRAGLALTVQLAASAARRPVLCPGLPITVRRGAEDGAVRRADGHLGARHREPLEVTQRSVGPSGRIQGDLWNRRGLVLVPHVLTVGAEEKLR